MAKKRFKIETATLDRIVGGGQALGTLENGKKLFAWGGLPGEVVSVQLTKQKSSFVEGKVVEVHSVSDQRIEPRDPISYLSTSPWQIMNFEAEQHYKAALIEEAFELHDIVLPEPIEVYTDGVQYEYRNKVEFSWYGDVVPVEPLASEFLKTSAARVSAAAGATETRHEAVLENSVGEKANGKETLDLAFFVRGSKGKVPVSTMSLARPEIMKLALEIRDLLRTKVVKARNLKTLLIRCNQKGECVWQLYIKDDLPDIVAESEAKDLSAIGGEIIYSDPRSPASKITKRLKAFGVTSLQDELLGISFHYATESFFQVNIPVYLQALDDMKSWLSDKPVVDMYSGVGTIGLTIGGKNATLVELDPAAVQEMKRNITELGSNATAVLAASENALEQISSDKAIILDPPRAGLHESVIERLLDQKPERIIYLSCNPVTQARDVARLAEAYGIRAHKGYNFFPRTPHIEHLVVLDLR